MPAEVVVRPQFRGLKAPYYLRGGVGGGKARNIFTEELESQKNLIMVRDFLVSLFSFKLAFFNIMTNQIIANLENKNLEKCFPKKKKKKQKKRKNFSESHQPETTTDQS